MERHEVLEMMAALKLAGHARCVSTRCSPTASSASIRCRIIGELLKAEIGQAGAIHQVPDEWRQAAAGQGAGRLRLHRHPGQRAAGPRVGGRRLPGQPAQRRADRRHRHRQEPSRRRHRAGLHPRWRPGPLLQRRSTWSTGIEAEARAGRQGRLADQNWPGATSSSSTSSATCPSPKPEAELLFHLVSRR